MLLYGLLDQQIDQVIDFYPSREQAEAVLAEMLGNEPDSVAKLELVLIDVSSDGLRVKRRRSRR